MKPPLLVFSELSGTVYIVTRYKVRDGGLVTAERKYDVTDQFFGVREQFKKWSAKKQKQVAKDFTL